MSAHLGAREVSTSIRALLAPQDPKQRRRTRQLQIGVVVERALGTRRIDQSFQEMVATAASWWPRTTQQAELGSLSTVNPARVAQEWIDRRAADRSPMTLPAFINIEGEKYNARLVNLAHGGALIETLAPVLLPNSTMALHCGTIAVGAVVVWTKDHQIGVKFETPLTDAQVSEQVFRTLAIASRRESRLQSGRPE